MEWYKTFFIIIYIIFCIVYGIASFIYKVSEIEFEEQQKRLKKQHDKYIEKLLELKRTKEKGLINQEEFEKEKERIKACKWTI